VTERLYLPAADALLVIHVAFVAYVVLGFALIWIGFFLRRRFVRNPWFRFTHLLAMGIVAAQTLSRTICPLTEWEAGLRRLAGADPRYAGSFIEYWLHRLLYFDWSEQTFRAIYLGFFGLILLTLWLVPPRWPRRKAAGR
jgi:hypothetical protein